MSDYLARLGETLVKNGYAVIPIVPGTKRPPGWMSHEKGDPWSAVEPSVERVRAWARDKRLPGAGVGINLGRNLLAIDIDTQDESLSAWMQEWCRWNLPGNPPLRIGLAPKCLLLFRCDTPIRKQASKIYLDGATAADGKPRRAQVECLGQGEQFVAYATHPDTGKPYTWPEADLIDTPIDALSVITLAQVREAIAAWEGECERRGLAVKPGGSSGTAAADADDWTMTVDPGKAGLSLDDLRERLKLITNDGLDAEQDFDTWLQVGMSVFHETDGSEEGFAIWSDWSAQSSKHIAAECERRWKSFDVSDKDRRPITARWLIKITGEIKQERVEKALVDLQTDFAAASTEDQIRKVADRIKALDLDHIKREVYAAKIQRKFRDATNAPFSLSLAREMIRYEKPGEISKPAWAERWVYINSTGEFFNRVNQCAMKAEQFDAAHSRYLITDKARREGKATPDTRPSDLALNLYTVPVVDRRMYLPGERDDVVKVNGVTYVNTYSDMGVPAIPAKLTAQHREDLATVQAHMEWLVPDARERGLLLSYLSHVVKGGRVRWAVVLHGVEGAGKTFFFVLMAHCLGQQNVRTVQPTDLGKEFNGWAEGSQFTCIEEIKMHGHSRFDVLNSLKPLITNDYVSVRRMRTDPYMVQNTASYMALTNYADALPIDDRDRRYMILSAAPTKDDVAAVDPGYFPDLFKAVERSNGAIRGWLHGLEAYPGFSADGRAPDTAAKGQMIGLGESDEVAAVRDMMDEGRLGVSRRLLSTTHLTDAMEDAGLTVPMTRTLGRALLDLGMTYLGRPKIGGRKTRVWSATPSEWRDARGQVDNGRVREWLENDI